MKNRLNDIRHELKIDNQTEFAKILGVNQAQISRWKRHVQEPSAETCYNKILPALKKYKANITFEDLWEPK